MELQESGTTYLPPPITMQILSAWDKTFEKLSRKNPKPEDHYLAGEAILISLILHQLTGFTREKCSDLLKNLSFLNHPYNRILEDVERDDDLNLEIHSALNVTVQILHQYGLTNLPFTFLGTFFERFGIFGTSKKSPSARNATGSFFTPLPIAQFIVNKTLEIGHFSTTIEEIKCLDPACGSGIFLMAMAEALLGRTLKQSAINSIVKADCIRNILTKQLWGIDVSPNAQRVSQLQLILWAYPQLPNSDLEEICTWVDHCSHGDFLSNNQDLKRNFSVIVGNPPFGNLLSNAQKLAAKGWATTRTWEISELFLERALGILNQGGCIGFVMPKTMAYYAQWNRARALLLPTKLAGVADLGLSFPGVNFETLALFAQKLPAGERKDPFPIFAEGQGTIGTFPRQYINETGLIPLQPLNPDDEKLLNIIRKNSVPLSRLVHTYEVTRGIYLPEEAKANCKAGNLLWINRVPDIQHYAIKRLWRVDPAAISLANPNRLKAIQCPKVLVKVLRGRKLSVMADPWGILVPTEKLVSILLDKSSPREILAWNACLNSWPASYYLQKVIFSGTTESARVLDYPYLKHVPVLLNKSQALNVLSGVNLALLLATQIQTQVPAFLPPKIIPSLGTLFQQVTFLAYVDEVPSDPQLSLEGDFSTNLQLLRDLLVLGVKKPPTGGLSRNNLATFTENQESTEKMKQTLEFPVRAFGLQVETLLSGDIVNKINALVEQNPQWHKLSQYFNSKF